MTEPTKPIVYEHPLSPYAQKVKLALWEKGIDFSTVHLGQMTAEQRTEFQALSPRSEVPCLLHNTLPIFDSTVILEYIEDVWPTPALLPATPTDRARVRMLEDVMDTHFEANTWGLSEIEHFSRASGDLATQLTKFAEDELAAWLRWLDDQLNEAQWFNGDTFGWGDICVVPFVNGAARFAVRPEPGSDLELWTQRANQRPSVIRAKQAADANELDRETMSAAIANGFKR